LRASAYQPEFGLLGAGSVSTSLIGRLPSGTRAIGPVAAVSYRVASRIANSLRAGTAVRSAAELDEVRTIVFYSPPEQAGVLLEILRTARIHWPGKSLIFCGYEAAVSDLAHFRERGASVAALNTCAIPGRLVMEGTAPAVSTARAMAGQLAMKCIEIANGSGDSFRAAATLGSGALTPLIDHAADLLRKCGVRDNEAPALAAALFQQTAKEYAHSGKQSWAWYMREPAVCDLEAQIAAVGDRFRSVIRELMLLGLEGFEKHPATASALRSALTESAEQKHGGLRQQIRKH
jgi:Domain of unknown function (DUF2520)